MCATYETNDVKKLDRSDRELMMESLHDSHERLMSIVDRFKAKLTKKEKIDLSETNNNLLIKIKKYNKNLNETN